MRYEPLTGKAAQRATLEAKLSVARLRSEHGDTKSIREEQGHAAQRYARELERLA